VGRESFFTLIRKTGNIGTIKRERLKVFPTVAVRNPVTKVREGVRNPLRNLSRSRYAWSHKLDDWLLCKVEGGMSVLYEAGWNPNRT
jgi:hypothetical protein